MSVILNSEKSCGALLLACAQRLARFMGSGFIENRAETVLVWMGQLRLRRHTDGHTCTMSSSWCALDGSYASICKGMTYGSFERQLADEAAVRKRHELRCRCRGGKSCVVAITRLELVILGVERLRQQVLIAANDAVIRRSFAKFMGKGMVHCPYIDKPSCLVFGVQVDSGDLWGRGRDFSVGSGFYEP